MERFFQNIYIGFTLLTLYILLGFFGSIQRMHSPNFESYTYESTKHIEGSGAVFGYMMATPSIQLATSIISMVFLSFIFLVLRIFFLKVSSVKIAQISYAICSFVIILLIIIAGIDVIDYIRWGFYLLALHAFMLILVGGFAMGHLKGLCIVSR